MPGTLAWQWSGVGDPRKSNEMATLLNSLLFVFTFSFMPTDRVKYYDYIVKWCSLISCNWCVSLNIA